VATSSRPSNAISDLEPALKFFGQKPSQTNPLSKRSMAQPAPIYTSPITSCISGNTAFHFGLRTDKVTSGNRANLTDSCLQWRVRTECSLVTPRMVRQWTPQNWQPSGKITLVHLKKLNYKIPLLCKHWNIQLPNSYAQAEKRLTGLKKRLKADDSYYARETMVYESYSLWTAHH